MVFSFSFSQMDTKTYCTSKLFIQADFDCADDCTVQTFPELNKSFKLTSLIVFLS